MRRPCLFALMMVAGLLTTAHAAEWRDIDRFDDPSAWQAGASDEVQASVVRDPRGKGLCLRYDFGTVSGYALLRRTLPKDAPLEFPAHYRLALALHGSGPPNALQLKFVDASGDNVWWMNRPAYVAPRTSAELAIRQRHLDFAWGPTEDRVLRRAASIELVVASGQGGRGELCFERLALQSLPPPPALSPAPVASASSGDRDAALALDGDAATAWRSGAAGGARGSGRPQHWRLDFGAPRELAGLLLRFPADARPRSLELQFSDDAKRWHTVRRLQGIGRDALPLWLPESETRYLRLVAPGGAPFGLAEVQAMGPAEWPTLDAALASVAKLAARGRFPRAYVGEQNYWTVVGVDGGGAQAALMSEDGAIEPRQGGPSIEPFVVDEAAGRIASWADAQRIEHTLREGDLPLPRVHWDGDGFALDVEAGADGPRERPQLVVRYTLANRASTRRTLGLALALRPWQVNPPRQFLNMPGGAAKVGRIEWREGRLRVDGREVLAPLGAPPGAVKAATFTEGDPLEAATRGGALAVDPQALASAALRWRLDLAPGEARSVSIVLPLSDAPAAVDAPRGEGRTAEARLDAVAAAWRERLHRVGLDLPPAAQPLVHALRSALAQILVSRDGPALRPGTRSYARTWIRDGAMMVAGLLRLGEVDAVREFVRWYAGKLFASGKVPCCVDARGADPVAENDSHGEFIFAVAELWRHSRDRAELQALWPRVDAAARYMESLRQSERQPAAKGTPTYGLMPASISHEGYSAKPMHAYWDDFWALAGYRDAARLAQALGLAERAAELARQRDEFAQDLGASLAAAVAQHRLDFLPGAAELGDFDPSSSTLAFSPAGAEGLVPRTLLESTWERYWRESVARREGRRDWSDYTPYELRSVSALLRLGHAERAHAMLDFFLHDQRPAGWNGWAEVVGREPREVRFVGDMPHAWIASDALRSILDLFAYERESDDALVLGAGVTEAWWRAGPVEARALRTAHGRVSLRLEREGASVLRLVVEPAFVEPPEGGLWFAWAGEGMPPSTTASGEALAWQGRLLRLPEGGSTDLRFKLAAP